ncbi:MAG: hypothetical protein DMF87_25735 [Acidobacteria bacterium]|nr:MAG: hypothetical protein DMF87_25735 [Acidobacteriota bacterium]
MRPHTLTALAVAMALPLTAPAQSLQLHVVSNPRPEFVSGGDVLLSVTPAQGVRLTLNGTDVTSAVRPDGFALVKNLNDGPNTIVATAGKTMSKLTVVNHPITGPVISGPPRASITSISPRILPRRQGAAAAPPWSSSRSPIRRTFPPTSR